MYDRVNDCHARANGCLEMLLYACLRLQMLMNMIIVKMFPYSRIDYSIGANDVDDHANESLLCASE